MNKLRIIDMTLRDGSHAVSHQFSIEQLTAVARGLDEAGVDTVEMSHGDGLGGSSIQYGFSKEEESRAVRAVADSLTGAKLAVLLLPGVGTKAELEMAIENGAGVARIGTHVTEADIAEQHIGMARDFGLEAIGFLMMCHMVGPEKILEQARLMESYGADMVYLMDSAGALLPDGVTARISALRQGLHIPVGFHAHNNLGLAIANTLAAIDAGATSVDACLRGLGAGAGNAQIEVLVAVLRKMEIETGIDLYKLMDVAEHVVEPIMHRPIVVDNSALLLGYAGVYSSFLLHADRASKRFGVDARDIIVECGRLKTVGGQEDIIIDIAADLARRASSD